MLGVRCIRSSGVLSFPTLDQHSAFASGIFKDAQAVVVGSGGGRRRKQIAQLLVVQLNEADLDGELVVLRLEHGKQLVQGAWDDTCLRVFISTVK